MRTICDIIFLRSDLVCEGKKEATIGKYVKEDVTMVTGTQAMLLESMQELFKKSKQNTTGKEKKFQEVYREALRSFICHSSSTPEDEPLLFRVAFALLTYHGMLVSESDNGLYLMGFRKYRQPIHPIKSKCRDMYHSSAYLKNLKILRELCKKRLEALEKDSDDPDTKDEDE